MMQHRLNCVLLLCGVAATWMGATACSGDDGERGPAGPPGPAGLAGDAGPGGPGSTFEGGLATSCMQPCHGFAGVVEQWRGSTHFATFISTIGTEEVDSWTGPRACGQCHAVDALQLRAAGTVGSGTASAPVNVRNGQLNYLDSAIRSTESTYAGRANVAQVGCITCHNINPATDPHLTGQNYTPGSFPLRVPSGPTDQAYVEKTPLAAGGGAPASATGTPAGTYNAGNTCMWCHKSRKDVTYYITDSNKLSAHWGPHQGPHADVYSGKGGFHFGSNTYGNSSHQALLNGCVDCHMPKTEGKNAGIGDHSFQPRAESCNRQGCHANVPVGQTFEVAGNVSQMTSALRQLRSALNQEGWLAREATPTVELTAEEVNDAFFHEDVPRGGATLTKVPAGALYNYLLLARGSALGIHNALYTKQLIYDSYVAITDASDARPLTPPAISARP